MQLGQARVGDLAVDQRLRMTPITSPPAASARRRARPSGRPAAAVDDPKLALGEQRARARARPPRRRGRAPGLDPAVDADAAHSPTSRRGEQPLEVGLVVPGADRGAQVRVAGRLRTAIAGFGEPLARGLGSGSSKATSVRASARRDRRARARERVGEASSARSAARSYTASSPSASSTLERGQRRTRHLARERGVSKRRALGVQRASPGPRWRPRRRGSAGAIVRTPLAELRVRA